MMQIQFFLVRETILLAKVSLSLRQAWVRFRDISMLMALLAMFAALIVSAIDVDVVLPQDDTADENADGNTDETGDTGVGTDVSL